MVIQELIFENKSEVVVPDRLDSGEAYNRQIFTGTYEECREFIRDEAKID